MTSDTPCGTILVVDDNLDIRALAKRFLETGGWTVVAAADGEEGLGFYQEHQSNVVLLLTDVKMPKMSGLELADRVLGIDSQLPVLFMSGGAWSSYRGLQCIAKPFRSVELLDSVRRVLHADTPLKRTVAAA
jgi:two-component system cell cycle sensor histidine kinase/response regulator CckA